MQKKSRCEMKVFIIRGSDGVIDAFGFKTHEEAVTYAQLETMQMERTDYTFEITEIEIV
jgi:hypothetical protein